MLMVKNITSPIEIKVGYNNLKCTVTGRDNYFSMDFDGARIDFKVKVRNGGIYSKVTGYTKKNRYYQAERYLIKYASLAQGIAYQLCIGNYLWDYEYNCNGLESYAWGIKDYVEKCIELGISY